MRDPRHGIPYTGHDYDGPVPFPPVPEPVRELGEFGWPCDLRTAHGPHVLVTEEIHDASGRLLATRAEDCPGVGAHPDTMIGRVAKSVTK